MSHRCRLMFPGVLAGFAALCPALSLAQETDDQQVVFEVRGVPLQEIVSYELVLPAREQFWTGVQVAPVEAALRSQLDLADDDGVVVVSVESGSPADEAGIQPHDVLLAVDGEAVQDEGTLLERIGASEGESVSVVLLRGGSRLTLEVTPRPRYWEVETYVMDHQYRIGVQVADMDEALRSHLRLREPRGLVVMKVFEESPAAEAGIEQHDILITFGGKPLKTTEDLTSQVQEVGDHAATMEFIRKGERQSLRVTPERQTDKSQNYFIVSDLGELLEHQIFVDVVPEEETTEQQLQQLIQEMEALTARMEALQRSLQESAEGEAAGREAEPEGAGEGE